MVFLHVISLVNNGCVWFKLLFTYFHSDIVAPNHCNSATCPQHSKCHNSNTGFTCVCNPGYTGQNCSTSNSTETYMTILNCFTRGKLFLEIDFCQGVTCENKGTCVSDTTGYHCQCTPGYTGPLCETFMDPCNSNPCENGGYCLSSSIMFKLNSPLTTIAPHINFADYDQYTCSCVKGFYGPNCENGFAPC